MPDYFRDSVVLKLKPFRKPVAAILDELNDGTVLEEEFLPDPAGFLALRLHGAAALRVPRRRLDAANRFLFSAMSNERFRAWMESYQEERLSEIEKDPYAVVDKERLLRDLAQAMAEAADPEIIASLLPGRFKPRWDDPDLVFDVIGTIKGPPDWPPGAVVLNQIVSQTVVQEVTQTVTVIPTLALSGRLAPGGEVADVAVEIETVAYAVAAVAVFIVAVAVAVVGAQARDRFAGRPVLRDVFVNIHDMARIADSMARIGGELRGRGML